MKTFNNLQPPLTAKDTQASCFLVTNFAFQRDCLQKLRVPASKAHFQSTLHLQNDYLQAEL